MLKKEHLVKEKQSWTLNLKARHKISRAIEIGPPMIRLDFERNQTSENGAGL